MGRKPPNPQQKTLALTRDERLTALDQADAAALGVPARQWRSVRELLRQIEFCGGADSSYARVEVLAARCGVSERTVQRARRVAEAAGLLVVEERHNHNGQASNRWLVNWDRLASRRQLSPTPDVVSPTPDVVSPTPDILSPTGDVMSPPIESRKNSSESRQNLVDRKRAPLEVDWRRAEHDAARLEGKIGPCRSEADRSLCVKAAALAQHYGERWLWDAAEGCRLQRPRRPWAYFWTCAQSGADALQRNLRRDLARLTPAERTPLMDLSERLCAAGEETL